MAAFTLTNSQILVGSFDATTFTGSFSESVDVEMVSSPTFGSGGFDVKYPGLATYSHTLDGNADFATTGISAAFTPASLGTQQLVAIQPTGGATAGDPTMFTRGLLSKLVPFSANKGEVDKFSMTVDSDSQLTFGQVAAPLSARTATANGSVLTMTGPTASQKVYAGLLINTASGTTPSLTVKVQSATLVGFGSPTDRITFTAANAAGWQFGSVAGAITDGFWRATWTVSGTSPSFTFAVVVGVANT